MALSDLKSLVEKFDLGRIAELAKKVDLVKVVGLLSQLEPSDLAHLASQVRAKKRMQALPEPHGDFYDFGSLLVPEDHALKLRVRKFMRESVAPIVNDYWLRGEFPMQLVKPFAELDLAGLTFKGYGFPGRSCVLEGLIAEESARVDVSMST
ncbi:MAG: acyl-CoA dehydrogenase family protein, partial [Polyangiaceae bacterium]